MTSQSVVISKLRNHIRSVINTKHLFILSNNLHQLKSETGIKKSFKDMILINMNYFQSSALEKSLILSQTSPSVFALMTCLFGRPWFTEKIT